MYDHPAMIDFILKNTKQKRLFNVCHSEGCTELFVMASLRPEYNNKIKLSVNLSPSVLYGHSPLILRSIFMFSYLLQVNKKEFIEKRKEETLQIYPLMNKFNSLSVNKF